MARNAIKSEFRTSKLGAGGHLVKKNLKNRIDLKWPEMCDRKLFSDIQNGRRQPFCQKFQKKIKLRIDLNWPEMRSKVNFGHPKLKKKQFRIDLKWPEMPSKVSFGHPK